MTTIPQTYAVDLPVGATVIDVREPNEYAAGHVPGAVSIPLGEVRSRAHEVPRDEPVYLICRSGGRSQKAAEHLAGLGLDVRNVAGGTAAYAALGRPLQTPAGQPGEVVAPATQPPSEV